MGLSSQMINYTPVFPEIVLLGATLILLILGLFRGEHAFQRVMLISKITLGTVFLMVCTMPAAREVAFHGLFVSDSFSILMKALVVASAFIVLTVSSKSLVSEDIAQYEYPLLVLFATLGMMVMISANDLISLFMGLELQTLSLYVITALRRDHSQAVEAGMKYFVLGALSTCLLLYGCSLIYGYTGTTNFVGIAGALQGMPLIPLPMMLGGIFLMAGLIFKVSGVPFHMWTPDVYEGAPLSVTTFLASAPKLAAFALLTRVLISPFLAALPQWQMLVAGIAVGSMVLGAFAALIQRNIKRLLAYSAIGNMGYALLGIVVGTEEGVTASLVYLILYVTMILGIFACLLSMTRRGQELTAIDDLKGLVRIYPGTAMTLSLLLFSLAGIPPLAGFLGKLYIFQTAIAGQFYGLALIGVLTTVVAAAYYLWIIKVLMMDEPSVDRWANHRAYQRETAITFVLLGIVGGLVWIFISPSLVVAVASDAAMALFNS